MEKLKQVIEIARKEAVPAADPFGDRDMLVKRLKQIASFVEGIVIEETPYFRPTPKYTDAVNKFLNNTTKAVDAAEKIISREVKTMKN
jgi:hypothetical protein